MNTNHFDAFITVEEAATTLKVSDRFIQKLCKTGEIKAIKLSKVWRIHLDQFCKQFSITPDQILTCKY